MLTEYKEAPERPPPLRRRFSVALVLVVVLAFGSLLLRIPYDAVAPGSATPVNDLIEVKGQPTYPPHGKVLYVTVAVRERVNVVEAVAGWVDPDIDVVPERDLRGSIPPQQFERLNVEAMADSKTSAELVALRHLGFPQPGDGAKVVEVDPKLPAASVLQRDDVITAVDGKAVSRAEEAVTAIKAHKAGDEVRMTLRRGGDPPRDVVARMAADAKGGPLLGVRLTTDVKLPFEVTIHSGDVVGPSAGLAYSLELLDLLTPGELTGGMTVAATGEISSNGDVLPIGGVAQKAVSVRHAGAKVMLVPKQNYDEAKAHAGRGLQVYAVASVDDALRVLGSLHGSNAMALAPPGPGA